MIPARLRGDRGSTLPISIWLTGILLFAAFAFFAFAQAASARNGAQSAADAAALAAAQSARDELVEGLGDAVGGADWWDWLDPENLEGGEAAAAADELAAANDASVTGFAGTTVADYLGYEVEIQTNYTVGDSLIPGTENMQATADAVAVIEPRCDFDVPEAPKDVVELDCDGELVNIDPEDFDLDDLPDASVLFSVHLAE
ncbi:pilus assembly protein TadG-related protein [Streptomyces sp. ActVer]|uniref:pilus assembly protein TadG-related protein n=1 Tax=Streptomyces sp. ActVer TaxID=3014558 RepID=UPI0022B3D6C0|nr:pilus assembly protein TadG-related protein [Streptomyces sp. ActVer]MCZ4512589.1 pilus assembly protein TadG-related protein [Streptomyces sp. ActVer]